MGIWGVHLLDRPCAGKYVLWDSTQNSQPTLVCDSFTYYLTFGRPPNDFGSGGNATASITPPITSAGVVGGSSMGAWNQLRHTVNRTLPGELHLASRYLRDALTDLRRVRLRG